MNKYLLVDYYEDYGIVGRYETKQEAEKAKRKHERDCDGECNCKIIEYIKRKEY